MTLPALILAGSRGHKDPLCDQEKVALKALIKIAGQPMIDHVARAASETPGIGVIYLCLSEEIDLPQHAPFCHTLVTLGRAIVISPAHSPASSARKVWDVLEQPKSLLITTADHPLLTPDIITDFLKQSSQGVHVAMACAENIMAAYPQARRTKLRFKDGGYSGCNLFLLKGVDAGNILTFWQKLETLRKKPLQMALKIGILTALLYQMKQLSLREALRIIGRKSKTDIHVIMIDNPRAAIDVDKIEDLELVRAIFAEGA
jgi:GTP:adenosylcobinamide-phosphate guanylyltransferase